MWTTAKLVLAVKSVKQPPAFQGHYFVISDVHFKMQIELCYAITASKCHFTIMSLYWLLKACLGVCFIYIGIIFDKQTCEIYVLQCQEKFSV